MLPNLEPTPHRLHAKWGNLLTTSSGAVSHSPELLSVFHIFSFLKARPKNFPRESFLWKQQAMSWLIDWLNDCQTRRGGHNIDSCITLLGVMRSWEPQHPEGTKLDWNYFTHVGVWLGSASSSVTSTLDTSSLVMCNVTGYSNVSKRFFGGYVWPGNV